MAHFVANRCHTPGRGPSAKFRAEGRTGLAGLVELDSTVTIRPPSIPHIPMRKSRRFVSRRVKELGLGRSRRIRSGSE